MLKSKGEYWLPVVIAGKKVTVLTGVVMSDIPLLLSREAMKTAGVKIDSVKDTITLFGEKQVLNVTAVTLLVECNTFKQYKAEYRFSVDLCDAQAGIICSRDVVIGKPC